MSKIAKEEAEGINSVSVFPYSLLGTSIPKAVSERQGPAKGIKSICQIIHLTREFLRGELDVGTLESLTYVTQLEMRVTEQQKTIAASFTKDHTATLQITCPLTGNT